MNRIFYCMILVAFIFAAFREVIWSVRPAALATHLAHWVPSVDWIPAPTPLAPGSAGSLQVTLTNDGEPTKGLTEVRLSGDQALGVGVGSVPLPTNWKGSVTVDIPVKVAATHTTGDSLPLHLELVDAGAVYPLDIVVPVPWPHLAFDTPVVTDLGSGDGRLDPGEQVGVSVAVRNTGNLATPAVTCAVGQVGGPAANVTRSANLPVLKPGGEGALNLKLSAAGAVVGDTLDFQLACTGTVGAWTGAFSVPVGAAPTPVVDDHPAHRGPASWSPGTPDRASTPGRAHPVVTAVLPMPATDADAPKAPMERMSAGLFDAAKASVNLAIGLVGAMAFFLGLMKVAEAGGMLKATARAIRPVMELLFPDVPADHPAMGAMIMNMSANALGLGNAATPFGIKAMQELDTLNPEKGTATNAMALFLAINTSSVTILPTGVIALRDVMGSDAPAAVMGTTLFATIFSTLSAVTAAKVYQRFSPDPVGTVPSRPITGKQVGVLLLYACTFALMVTGTVLYGNAIGPWVVPLIVLGMLSWGYFAGVQVYEVFVEGAKDGFSVATKIIPYLVAILGAVGMLRGAGAVDVFSDLVGGFTTRLGMPAEALPMALLRPLSGSGAYGVMTDILKAEGPDSYAGLLVSTLQGSTETTFYVIAVYFGAVQVTKIRHTMAAALTADLVGIISAIIACQLYFALNG